MEKYLIVNSDDFGITEGVNRGIVQAHQSGVVSSATIMANMPGFEDSVQWAKKLPRLGVGMHFTLTYGSPVSLPSRVPSLVNKAGMFHKFGNTKAWDEADVERELLAQWKRFTESELVATHLDSHHNVQEHEVVYRPMIRLARAMNLPMRKGYPESLKSQHHPPTTDEMISDEYFHGDGVERFIQYVQNLKPGVTEINCHPGYVDEALKSISPWTDVREAELKTVTDERVVNAIRQSRVQLIHFGDLRRIRNV